MIGKAVKKRINYDVKCQMTGSAETAFFAWCQFFGRYAIMKWLKKPADQPEYSQYCLEGKS